MERKTAIKQLQALKKDGAVMRLAAEGWKEEWQTLLAILMSARTRDETTIKVAKKLFKQYQAPRALAFASARDVSAIVHPVNFFRNKTKNIIATCRLLVEHFDNIVPHDLEKLVTIPGVGRKTANVFLSEIGRQTIGVDTHVSYISQKLGWTKHHDPHKIERDLKQLFPKKYWSQVNVVCVRFGKTHMSRKKKNLLLAQIAGEERV